MVDIDATKVHVPAIVGVVVGANVGTDVGITPGDATGAGVNGIVHKSAV